MSQQYYQAQWRMTSMTPGRVDKQGLPAAYTVSLRTDGTWECSCPAWIYQRKNRGDCKHILFCQDHPELYHASSHDRQTQRVTRRVQNIDYTAELIGGRLAGFISDLDCGPNPQQTQACRKSYIQVVISYEGEVDTATKEGLRAIIENGRSTSATA